MKLHPPSLATEVAQVASSRRSYDPSPLMRGMPVVCQMVALGVEVNIRSSSSSAAAADSPPAPFSYCSSWLGSCSGSFLLAGSSFEPLLSCSLRSLIMKVLFLLSLATAKRVSGLQALSYDVAFQGPDMSLSY